ncbi:PilZ domain-containing protein [Methylomagnum ishizawai]|uniref:PilZ domain-containing protein n=1 Tax=Methylomagnum ishizawai TaxID=1760988 RepID=A0A1Y6CWE1_9GAMM|nr:PilZ domain-containing protein [Methylomagnum ishizawai]SMF94657.1 PilZ domain-containing protein [Methylomagnum ishizawai]
MNENRGFFRKKTRSDGIVLMELGELQFGLKDLSVEGFKAHFERVPPFGVGDVVRIRLPDLHLEGCARAMRIDKEGPGKGFLVGFMFTERHAWDPGSVFIARPPEDGG